MNLTMSKVRIFNINIVESDNLRLRVAFFMELRTIEEENSREEEYARKELDLSEGNEYKWNRVWVVENKDEVS